MESTSRSVSSYTNQFLICAISIILMVAITFAAYKPVLFNFFFMDDFCFLFWLREAVNHPTILQQAFCHHYMNEPYYYRPLIELFWALEFFFWRDNGLVFRICSISLMLLSSLAVGLIVFELSKSILKTAGMRITWSLFSATLFDLYPLHVSAVNWFAAQHTVLVCLFYLLSTWSYLSWRRTFTKSFFILSLSCFILALLTEEMATTLPFILFAYEIFCTSSIFQTLSSMRILQRKVIATLPYWLVLVAYFCVRKLVLGNLNSQLSGVSHQRLADLFHRIKHGLQHLFVPIDLSAISKNSPLTIGWELMIIACLGLSICTLLTPGRTLQKKCVGIFLLIWFMLGLAPASNILGTDGFPHFICDRVSYLATVPLCIFLAYGITSLSSEFKYSKLIRTIGGAYFLLSAVILYYNNEAYYKIGQQSNEIIKDLQSYYKSIPNDPPINILALPPPTNALGVNNIAKKPFLYKDFYNCYLFDPTDPSVSFETLRESKNKQKSISFLYWNAREKRLKPTEPYSSIPILTNFPLANYKRTWQGEELKALFHSSPASQNMTWVNNRVLPIRTCFTPIYC